MEYVLLQLGVLHLKLVYLAFFCAGALIVTGYYARVIKQVNLIIKARPLTRISSETVSKSITLLFST